LPDECRVREPVRTEMALPIVWECRPESIRIISEKRSRRLRHPNAENFEARARFTLEGEKIAHVAFMLDPKQAHLTLTGGALDQRPYRVR